MKISDNLWLLVRLNFIILNFIFFLFFITTQQVLAQKNVQKTTFEAAEMMLGPWNQHYVSHVMEACEQPRLKCYVISLFNNLIVSSGRMDHILWYHWFTWFNRIKYDCTTLFWKSY